MSTRYTCGHCGRTVSKSTRVCPHCGTRLGGIRCNNCGFLGSETDFLGDRCPKCGSQVTTSRALRKCRCGKRLWMFCGDCGEINWGIVRATLFFGIVAALATIYGVILVIMNPETQNLVSYLILTGMLGVSFLLLFFPIRAWVRRRDFRRR